MIKKLSKVPFIALTIISILCVFYPAFPTHIVSEGINSGDVAWMLTSTALVMLMTPGLALFYGGMVNSKNVISTMLQSFICMGVVSILWVVIGFSIAFGPSFHGWFGNPSSYFLFHNILEAKPWVFAPTVPFVVFALFQIKFAVITPAVIAGSFSERIRFTSYVLFACLFSLFIYAPIAHWIWHPDGFLFKMGVLDFAGGTVVEVASGFSALAAALYLGKKESGRSESSPANIPFVLLGAGLLWFGWFGFNAGSSYAANSLAATAFATTNTAAAAAGLGWIFFEAMHGKKPSALGFCIGAVVGLVAITPAAGYVSLPISLFIGFSASIISNLVVGWRSKSTIDDTLDVFPCHGIGGVVGVLLTGVFASKIINPAGADGWYLGNPSLFKSQLIAVGVVIPFSFFGSLLLLKITDMISPLKASKEEQEVGLDISQHGESL